MGVEVTSDDRAVIDYLVEYLDPWFRPAPRAVEWRVTVTSTATAYAEMQRRQPAQAPPRPCFAHDRQVMSLPGWPSDDGVDVCDADRSCFLRIGPGHVHLIADPRTRRWRFTLLWVVQEIAATRLRQSTLDLHAAAVEHAGRTLLIGGPKGAGKTTLSFHLMQRHRCTMIANDRSFVRAASGALVTGMPTAVKIRPPTLAQFPHLQHGLPPVARPYLYTEAELETAVPTEEHPDAVDFALAPNQLAARLGVASRAASALGAIVLPRVCADEAAWAIEPMATAELGAALVANQYGAAAGPRPATLFEEFGGGVCSPSAERFDAVAAGTTGYRVRLGRNAYADATLGERLLALLSS